MRSTRIEPPAPKAVNRTPLGCSGVRTGGKHLRRDEKPRRVPRRIQGSLPSELDLPGSADRRDGGFDGGGIDGGRLISGETQENGAVGSMARPVRRGSHRGRPAHAQRDRAIRRFKSAHKSAGCAHGAHRMRAGRADADLEQIEETGGHGSDCSGKSRESGAVAF